VLLAGCALRPVADHHQHLFSPATAALIQVDPLDAQGLVGLLDQAGIQRAVVLSMGYTWGKPGRNLPDEYEKVKAENDWTAAQAARYPGRLTAFCGFNPLAPYALQELERCAADPRLRTGIKLHFGNSDVQLERADHIARLREVFAAANRHGMAIVIHMRASFGMKRDYGAVQGRAFLEQLLPAAPDVTVQIAHFASSGPGYDDPPAWDVMAVLAHAVARHDPRTRHLYFDLASLPNPPLTSADAGRLVAFIRQVGPERVLYGSDSAAGINLRPREAVAAFEQLPLSSVELRTILSNLAPYF
jgi:predicted TIM-barrel fold metal-dependent hydrolase